MYVFTSVGCINLKCKMQNHVELQKWINFLTVWYLSLQTFIFVETCFFYNFFIISYGIDVRLNQWNITTNEYETVQYFS